MQKKMATFIFELYCVLFTFHQIIVMTSEERVVTFFCFFFKYIKQGGGNAAHDVTRGLISRAMCFSTN